jgi:hypothetical protein
MKPMIFEDNKNMPRSRVKTVLGNRTLVILIGINIYAIISGVIALISSLASYSNQILVTFDAIILLGIFNGVYLLVWGLARGMRWVIRWSIRWGKRRVLIRARR